MRRTIITTLLFIEPFVLLHLGNTQNKPAFVDSNYAPGASIWRTRQNVTSCLILAHWLHYVKTWRYPQNRKYIRSRCRQIRTEPRPQWDMRADTHTHTHTHGYQRYIQADRRTSSTSWERSSVIKSNNCCDCSACLQVLHCPGSGCCQLIMWVVDRTYGRWKDGNRQRHGKMSRQIYRRLRLLVSDRRCRAGVHFQRLFQFVRVNWIDDVLWEKHLAYFCFVAGMQLPILDCISQNSPASQFLFLLH